MQSALAVSQAKYWHLKQVGLFSMLADWELRQLVNIADLRLFKRGEEVYVRGDLSEHFFILRTGKVKLFRETDDGKQIILGFQGAGDIFGETAATGEPYRVDSAKVVDDAFICMINRDRFAGYLLEHPDLALQITRVIADRKQRIEQRLLDLLSKDVRTRLAHALADLASRYGQQDETGLRIDLRLTQTDLGQLVGSTRETTSMAFNGFRRGGLVQSRDRVIWVLDQAALAAF